ncbi:MAG: LysM peptidoglycan-binding domain-containing protein [Evtepia sp.]
MELRPMQYKGFVWPHNPRTYTITYDRQVAVHKVPFGRYAMQDLGMTHRVMRGEGEFVGPEAYDTFRALASVFYEGGPGTLLHPVWQSAQVYFVALALTQEPRKDYVRYTFTFWETYSRYRDTLAPAGASDEGSAPQTEGGTTAPGGRTHTVAQGETLWGIAQAWGVTLGELLAKNPQLKNPNVIQPGQVLMMP